MRPDVATVGVGRVRVWLAVVWVTLKVVATSTVAVLVPMSPPPMWLLMLMAVSRVELALVKVEPVATVSPPLAVARPVKVLVPVTARVPPNVVAPVPTVRVPVPVTLRFLPLATVVSPFRDTLPVPVENVPVPV